MIWCKRFAVSGNVLYSLRGFHYTEASASTGRRPKPVPRRPPALKVVNRGSHGFNEAVKRGRFRDEGVRTQIQGLLPVLGEFGGGEDRHRHAGVFRLGAHHAQQFKTIHPRQIQIQNDGSGQFLVGLQVACAFFSIRKYSQVHFQPGHAQGLLDENHVRATVLRDNDAYKPRPGHQHASLGTVNLNVAPQPGCDSTQILPPCLSTIPRQRASPIPVP